MTAVPWPHRGGCLVCVSLAEPSPRRLLARFDDVASGALRGAELLEVRLDALEAERDLTTGLCDELVQRSPVPLGFTLRPRWQGGAYDGDERQRRAILERAAAAGAGFVDVELEASWSADFVAASPAPVVLSHHWYEPGVPDDLHARVAAARAIAPAVVKLVSTARSPQDALLPLRAGAELIAGGQAATAFCMGEAGRASRLLAAARGAAIIYAAAESDGAVAPGQWPLATLVDELQLSRWRPGFELYGLLGDPIDHSLSPRMFNEVFCWQRSNRAYLPLPGADLEGVLRLAAETGVRGVSVTMPFKEEMAGRCVRRDGLVEATGAANTVLFEDDGWAGYNTDGGAVVDALSAVWPPAAKRVALLGAGGAARAAAVALADAGAELTVLNRTPQRAAAVAALAGAEHGPLAALQHREFDVLINATPVGMQGTAGAGDAPFPLDWLRGDEVVFDMVYRPRRTPLLRRAAARGCTVIDGLEMFVRQGAAQYRLLTGDPEEAPLALMRATVAAALGEDDDVAKDSVTGGTS